MARTPLIIAGTALLAGVVAIAASIGGGAGKDEARLAADTASGERAAIRHQLPSFKWFGERDESRLPTRPIGSVSRIIETEDGVVAVLDTEGASVLVRRDAAAATTILAQDPSLPPVTPRQAFDSPAEIVFSDYGPRAAPRVE